MHGLLLSLSLFAQAEIGLPPAPAASLPAANAPAMPNLRSLDEMKAWLLARLIIDMSFDAEKSLEVRRLIDTMNEQQMRMLIAAYQEKAAKSDPLAKTPLASTPQQGFDEAKLNLQQAQAYRDHLKREYDRQVLQGQMTQNLVYQNIVNNQRAMYLQYGPYSYGACGNSPWGYGGLSYGVMNYGGFGYGAPGFGGQFIYGLP